jgi:hypothetical protein
MRQNSTLVIGGISATNASQVTASFDCRGYSFARFSCFANSNAAVSTTVANHVLSESDDNSVFSTISTSNYQVALSLGTTTATVSTALAKLIYDMDLRGRKRYIRVQYSSASTTELFVVADLSLPQDGKTTAAEVGAAFYAQA